YHISFYSYLIYLHYFPTRRSSDLVVVSIGIRPNTAFLKDSGIKMDRGTIVVDGQMRTNLPDVYAAGDCVVVKNRITGKPQWTAIDRKSTRLNSSHVSISYAVFCLK